MSVSTRKCPHSGAALISSETNFLSSKLPLQHVLYAVFMYNMLVILKGHVLWLIFVPVYCLLTVTYRDHSRDILPLIICHLRINEIPDVIVAAENYWVFQLWTEGVWERGAGRIFGPGRDEVTGGWRKLHNEEFHNLYSSPSINRIIKSRRMRWLWHVARTEEKFMQDIGRKARRKETNIKTKI
jgi:hypothetical protein